jgi:hypothetical protein
MSCESWTDQTGTVHANFDALTKRARGLIDHALIWVRADCLAAAEANPDGPKAGFYLDFAGICSAELKRRDLN